MVDSDVSDGEKDWKMFRSKLSKLAAVEMKTRTTLEELVSAYTSALEVATDDSEYK